MCDPRLTLEAIDTVLGSMYFGEVTISTDDVLAIAAACRLLQLETLLGKCGELMLQNINDEVCQVVLFKGFVT